jgi:predicted outer membrane repeat protein
MFLAWLLWMHPSLAGATTRTVTSLNDDNGAGTLRTVIQASVAGDTINFDPGVVGTISLTNGALLVTNNLAIQGPGAAVLSVSGHSNSLVFSVSSVSASSISGLTIADGFDASPGGCILVGGKLILSDCILSNNVSTGFGGAIFCTGTLIASNCAFIRNSAAAGGGVFIPPPGTGTVSSCLFLSNSASTGSFGGGAIGAFGAVSLTNCTLTGNSAGQGGGLAILSLAGQPKVAIANCTICSNACAATAGGLGGGGICMSNGTASILNSIVAGNFSPGLGPDISVRGPGVFTSQGFNLIGATNDSTGWTATDLLGSAAAPIDPRLGPLQDNGGPTWTYAPIPGSPAIDAGNSFGLGHDQRGRVRPVDLPNFPNAPGGDGSDIGAFEVNPPVLSITQFGPFVLLSWPTSSDPGYGIQSTDSLSPPAWLPLPGNPVIVGEHHIAVDAIQDQQFYRLVQ